MARRSKSEITPSNKGQILASEIAKMAEKLAPVPVISPFREIAQREKTAAQDIEKVNRGIARIRDDAGKIQQEDIDAILPYGITLEEVQRMAMQLMTFDQIAAVFGLPKQVFLDCLKRFPAMRHVYETGAANMIDRATAVLRAAVELGDTATARFVLERKGGWEPPAKQAQIVVVQPGMTTVDGGHVSELASLQRAIREAPDAELA